MVHIEDLYVYDGINQYRPNQQKYKFESLTLFYHFNIHWIRSSYNNSIFFKMLAKTLLLSIIHIPL